LARRRVSDICALIGYLGFLTTGSDNFPSRPFVVATKIYEIWSRFKFRLFIQTLMFLAHRVLQRCPIFGSLFDAQFYARLCRSIIDYSSGQVVKEPVMALENANLVSLDRNRRPGANSPGYLAANTRRRVHSRLFALELKALDWALMGFGSAHFKSDRVMVLFA
jgi:hypothetical protein